METMATEFEMSNPAYRWLETRGTVDYSHVINVFVSYDIALRSTVKKGFWKRNYIERRSLHRTLK